MTMAMTSPISNSEALRRTRSLKLPRRTGSNDSVNRDEAGGGEQALQVARRIRLERGSSSRGLERGTSSRGLGRPSRRRLPSDEEGGEGGQDDKIPDMKDMKDFVRDASDSRVSKPRGVCRTTSMDQDNGHDRNEPPLRRTLTRNKSCDGSTMPYQRIQRRSVLSKARMERTASVRRMGVSSRNVHASPTEQRRSPRLDRSMSERRFAAASKEDTVMNVPSRSMDGSSDAGRSARRGGRRSEVASSPRNNGGLVRSLSGRNIMGGSSQGGTTGVRRRRDPRLPDFERLDQKLRQEQTSDDSDDDDDTVEGHVVTRGKGLDDSNRRRKEPTLSKMSIDQLRDRLIGKEAPTEEEEKPEDVWADFSTPLTSDLNHDD